MSASITQFPSRHDVKLSAFVAEFNRFRKVAHDARRRSIERFERAYAEAEVLMPSEAELMDRDRTYSLMKSSGRLDRDAGDRALKDQIAHGDFLAAKADLS